MIHFQNLADTNIIPLLIDQAMEKYEGMALTLRDYELKKYDQWKAETKRSLPLLMKRPLLTMITSENLAKLDLVCITHCLNACWC